MKGESMEKEDWEIRDDIGTALVDADMMGISPDRLVLTMAKDAYDAVMRWQEEYQKDYIAIPWERFVRGYKLKTANVKLCGVKVVPAEWGTGWTLREKRKGKK